MRRVALVVFSILALVGPACSNRATGDGTQPAQSVPAATPVASGASVDAASATTTAVEPVASPTPLPPTSPTPEPPAPTATPLPATSPTPPPSVTVATPLPAASPTPRPLEATALDPDALRVRGDLVRADVDEPYLELHDGPGVETPTTALLPPWYAQLTATGRTETAPNGRPWIEVELGDWIDSVRTGWVNAAFVEPNPEGVAVTSAEVPPCSTPTIDELRSDEPPAPGSDLMIRSIDAFQFDATCLRVVVTLADPRDLLRPLSADDLMRFATFDAEANPPGAAAVQLSLDPAGSGVALVHESGLFSDPRFGLWSRWATVPHVSIRPDRSAVVLDYPTTVSGQRFIAPDGRWMWPFGVETGPGSMTVTGIDRPFEANLPVMILPGHVTASAAPDIDPVTAMYSGSWSLGTTETDRYRVGTSDYLTAAAPFAIRAEGLAPGAYSLFLGQDMVDGRPLNLIHFEITEAGADPPPAPDSSSLDALSELRLFAAGIDSARPPFADLVDLFLMERPYATLRRGEALDRTRWVTGDTELAQFVGEFDVLGPITTIDFPRLRADATLACGSSPVEWPESVGADQEIWVEPLVLPNQSCIDWWANTVFLNDAGEITGVSLLAFGP